MVLSLPESTNSAWHTGSTVLSRSTSTGSVVALRTRFSSSSEIKGLVLSSSLTNLVHLCGEDVGSNPAWTFVSSCAEPNADFNRLLP
jgi:hypothetical protein